MAETGAILSTAGSTSASTRWWSWTAIDFFAARRRGGRHRRAERRGQDDAAQRAGRRAAADVGRDRASAARDVTGAGGAERCRLGLVRTHQIPRPFSGMTVFENVFVAATHGGRLQRATRPMTASIDALALCGMLRRRQPARRDARPARPQAARTRARARRPARRVLLLDEIGGGLTDGEAGELVDDDPRIAAAAASPSSGSSISCTCCCRSPSG